MEYGDVLGKKIKHPLEMGGSQFRKSLLFLRLGKQEAQKVQDEKIKKLKDEFWIKSDEFRKLHYDEFSEIIDEVFAKQGLGENDE